MIMRTLLVGLGGLALACSSSRINPTVLRDTIGSEFAWNCTNGCAFDITLASPPLPADCPAGSVWGWLGGRFFWVCYFEPDTISSGYLIFGESCRPIVCKVDDDCPWAQFGSGLTYVCKNGLCESQADMTNAEVEQLCLSNDPRPSTCDQTAVRATPEVQQILSELAVSCPSGMADGGACVVPASCRQP